MSFICLLGSPAILGSSPRPGVRILEVESPVGSPALLTKERGAGKSLWAEWQPGPWAWHWEGHTLGQLGWENGLSTQSRGPGLPEPTRRSVQGDPFLCK